MLISRDLLDHFQAAISAPAQLCLIRVIGSDHEYVFRVRYKDVFLDYPVCVPLFDTADKVASLVNFDEIRKALVVMSKMVVPPGTEIDQNWNPRPQPVVLAPMPHGEFRYEW